jgi:Phospholipid-translocating P-type ATPase C-terminal
VICLLFYYSAQKSFEQSALFEMGTTVFVGACNSLQFKVAFLHHQWSYVQIFLMLLSVGGMLAYFGIISKFPVNLYEYYDTGYYLLRESKLFWFYGFFTVPVFVIFIDVLGYDMYYFFWPSKETLYREIELKVPFILIQPNEGTSTAFSFINSISRFNIIFFSSHPSHL